MRLTELDPRLRVADTGDRAWIAFKCPRCQRHEISIDFWGQEAGEATFGAYPDGTPIRLRMWHSPQGTNVNLETLSLTPSVNRDGLDRCGGWHGHLTNGNAI